ncbi:uncharacterized protein LOC116939325 isoform X2 [Petromyzon marinus]|uniref:Uncharacterized protein LOC116939325 isoform X2 n=1 Tax=Petromyzon marinus TaxID=7757 RepID=A0AAJ7SQL2_PETMA|nr:uncharacterized protein LOC116939325 isoform X2 [Petromyzon marinus]
MRTRRRPPTAGEEACRSTRARDDGEEEAKGGGEETEVAADGAQTPQRTQGCRLSRHRRGEARSAASQLGRMAAGEARGRAQANIMSTNAHGSAVLESGLAAHTSGCSESEHDISWNPLSPSQGPTAERRGAWPIKTNLADIIKKLKPVEEPMPNSMGSLVTLWMEGEGISPSSSSFSPEPIKHEHSTQGNKRRRVECRELRPEELVSMAKDIDRASRDGNNASSTVCSEHARSPPQHGNATTHGGVTTAFGADLPPQGSLHSATRLTHADILRERVGIARRSENGRDDDSTPTRILGTPVSSPLVNVLLPHELEPSSEPMSEHASTNSGDRPRPSQLTFYPPLQSTPKAKGSGWQYEADLHALFDEDTIDPSHPLSERGAVGTGFQDKLATASSAPRLAKKTACHSVQGLRCTSEAAQVLLAGDLPSCVIDAPPAGARARPLCYEPSGAADCAQRNKEVGSARPTNANTGDTVLAFAEGAARDGGTATPVIPGSNLSMENVFDDWEDDDWVHDSSFIAVSNQLSDLVTNSERVDATANRTLVVDEMQDNQAARLKPDSVEATSCLMNAPIKQSTMPSGHSAYFPNGFNTVSLEKQNSLPSMPLQSTSSSIATGIERGSADQSGQGPCASGFRPNRPMQAAVKSSHPVVGQRGAAMKISTKLECADSLGPAVVQINRESFKATGSRQEKGGTACRVLGPNQTLEANQSVISMPNYTFSTKPQPSSNSVNPTHNFDPAHSSKLNLNVHLNLSATSNCKSNLNPITDPNRVKPNAASTVIGEDEWDDLGNMDELLSRIREPVDGIWDKQSDIDPVDNKECALSASLTALTADRPPGRADAKPSGSGASCGVATTAGAVCFEVSSGTCPTKQHSFKFVRTNNNSAVERASDNDSLSLLAQGGMGTRSAVGASGSALTIPHTVHLNTVLPSHIKSRNTLLQARAAGESEKASVLVPLSSVLPAGAQTFVSKPVASVVPPTRRLTVPEAAAARPGPPRIGDFQGRSGGATGVPPGAPGCPLNRSRSAFDILSTNSKPVLRRHYTDTTVAFTGGPKQCGPEEIERKRQEALDRRRQSASQQYATQRATRPPIKLRESQTNTKT